jgi:hypothetical protein
MDIVKEILDKEGFKYSGKEKCMMAEQVRHLK